MKRNFLQLAAVALAFALGGCSDDNTIVSPNGNQTINPIDNPIAKCHNGRFVGAVEDNGVLSFKGIPYAKAPVNELRWKAPLPAEASNDTIQAKDFGNSAIQPYSPTETASSRTRSEDCLTLNVWTKDLTTKNKPVMIWIHGGSYISGGTSDPLSEGKFLVAGNPDIVLVTINYRLGLMGFIDFSHVPGGTDFPDAPYLGILDQQMAMRWVQQNIEAFGGDPKNVTIFGESAGGGSVCCHLVAKGSEGLFQHAIAMSGALNLTFSQKDFDKYDMAEALLRLSGCYTMDELMAIPEERILELIEMETGRFGIEGGSILSHLNNHPMRDDERSIIPTDPFKALAEGASKDVDVIIGSTSEEMKYWAYLYTYLGEDGLQLFCDRFLSGKEEEARQALGEGGGVIDKFIETAVCEQDEVSAKYPKIWERTELQTEMFFRMANIIMARNHVAAGGSGKTYMYYFGKGLENPDIKWLGACHSCELTYAFNIENFEKLGPLDPVLTKNFSTAFTNFARTGNPSLTGIVWTPYTPEGVNTMVIGNDCSMKMQETPRMNQVDLLLPYYLKFYFNK
ncbi:MAG: carboxylesterase family protein [Bacteroidales bacterium]|nr:carboxylesterase family protein [Bacteroidales bacterium]